MQDRIHGWAEGGLLSGGAAGLWTTRSSEDLNSGGGSQLLAAQKSLGELLRS